jgi:hypothetical protein
VARGEAALDLSNKATPRFLVIDNLASNWILFCRYLRGVGLPLARGKRNQPVLCYRERRHQYADRHECIQKYTSRLVSVWRRVGCVDGPSTGHSGLVYASIFSFEGGGCGA